MIIVITNISGHMMANIQYSACKTEIITITKFLNNILFTSACPTLDLSVADFSLLNVLHSEPTSITLKQK